MITVWYEYYVWRQKIIIQVYRPNSSQISWVSHIIQLLQKFFPILQSALGTYDCFIFCLRAPSIIWGSWAKFKSRLCLLYILLELARLSYHSIWLQDANIYPFMCTSQYTNLNKFGVTRWCFDLAFI